MLSLASELDMELFAGEGRSLSLFDGEGGGEGCFGFHEMFPGLGRTGGGLDGGLDVEDCFSKAAILSRSEPIFLGGGDSSAILSSVLTETAKRQGKAWGDERTRQH